MKADGFWTWWNQFGSVPLNQCVQRAKLLRGGGVIVKHGYWTQFNTFKNAGIPVAVERYVYPGQPLTEARKLAEGIARGAEFAVVNAEIEWERAGEAGGVAMTKLINEFKRLQPNAELYASVDTRGNRTKLPYQQVLGEACTGWMPMIYPKAFFFPPFQPAFHIPQAFTNSLDAGQDFQGKPVLPTMQTYDNVGVFAVQQQVAESVRRSLPGTQAYTICHATNAEWAAFITIQPTVEPPVVTPPPDQDEERIRLLELRLNLTGKVFQWAGYSLSGEEAPEETLATLHYLLHLAEQARDD